MVIRLIISGLYLALKGSPFIYLFFTLGPQNPVFLKFLIIRISRVLRSIPPFFKVFQGFQGHILQFSRSIMVKFKVFSTVSIFLNASLQGFYGEYYTFTNYF